VSPRAGQQSVEGDVAKVWRVYCVGCAWESLAESLGMALGAGRHHAQGCEGPVTVEMLVTRVEGVVARRGL
jgi:hypothetical protein